MNLAIGSDHAGYKLKEFLKNALKKEHSLKDFGTESEDSVDYPDYAHPLAETVEKGEYELGIVICGSGNGVNMSVNKHKGIRSALCWNKEITSLARKHNNANIIALPARFIEKELALELVQIFIETEFEAGRHLRRVNKI